MEHRKLSSPLKMLKYNGGPFDRKITVKIKGGYNGGPFDRKITVKIKGGGGSFFLIDFSHLVFS